MATDKTSPASREAPPPEQQDQSIKARKSSLFEGPVGTVDATRPFAEYVKVVPATPLSPGVKATLVVIAALVALLLLAALFTGHGPKRHRGRRAEVTVARPALALALSRAFDTTSVVANPDTAR
jgi:hypothetical protein